MAGEDRQIIQLVYDSATATQALSQFNQGLAQQEQELIKLTNVQKQYTKEGAVSTVTLKGVTAAGLEVSNTFRKVSKDGVDSLKLIRESTVKASQSAKEGEEAFKLLGDALLSFRTISRVAQIQFLHQAIGKLTIEFLNGVEAARKFSIAVAEIQTISQDAQLSTTQWTEGIIKLSNNFGKPAADVAAAAYDVLSNQIAKGADTFIFLDEVLRFATISVTSTANAGNLLGSVIKSFGLEVSQAREVSDGLFKAIELGRFRADELSNSLGRVGVSAHALGITYQEVFGALATLTVRGIKVDEVQTQLLNLINKLAKPSKDMVALFKEWGVNSGEAAIQTFGFLRVLQLVEDAAKKSNNGELAELGKLFKDIRAIKAAAGLTTGTALEETADAIDKITHASESANEAFKLVFESTGAQLEREFTKVHNFFLQLGGDFNNFLLLFGKDHGGLANSIIDLTNNFIQLGSFIPSVVISLVGLKGALFAAKVEATALAGGIGTIEAAWRVLTAAFISNPVGLALSVLTAIGIAIAGFGESTREATERINRDIEKSNKRLEESAKIANEIIKKEVQESILLYKESLTEASQFALQLLATRQTFQLNLVKDLATVEKAATKDLENNIKAAHEALKDHLKEIENQGKKTERAIDSLIKKIEEEKLALAEKIFEKGLAAKSPEDQLVALRKRFDELNQSAKDFADAKDFDKSNEAFKEAQRVLDKLTQAVTKFRDARKREVEQAAAAEDRLNQKEENNLAKRVDRASRSRGLRGNRGGGVGDAVKEQRDDLARDKALNKELDAKKALAAVEKTITDLAKLEEDFANNKVAADERHLALLKQQDAEAKKGIENQTKAFDQFKILQGTIARFDKDFKGDTGEEKIAKFQKLIELIEEEAKKAGLSVDAQAALDKELQRKKDIIVDQETSKKLQDEIDLIRKQTLAVAELNKSLEKNKSLLSEARQNVNNQSKEIGSTITALDKIIQGIDIFEVKGTGGRGEGGIEAKNERIAFVQEQLLQAKKTIEELKKAFADPNIKANELQDLIKAATNFINLINSRRPVNQQIKVGEKSIPQTTEELLKEVEALSKARTDIKDLGPIIKIQEDQANAVKKSLVALKEEFPEIAEAAKIASKQVDDDWTKVAQTFDASIDRIRILIKAQNDLAEAAARAAEAVRAAQGDIPIPGVNNQRGGLVSFFSSGGLARGTDTIPAMLSPNEMVINAAATKAFYPVLRAINNTHGSVSTTNVGDVNLNMNVANAADVDVRQLLNRLRREIRRGNW